MYNYMIFFVIVMTGLVIGISSSVYLKYNKKKLSEEFIKRFKKLASITVCIIMLIAFYFNTDDINDYIIVVISLITLFSYIYVTTKDNDSNKINDNILIILNYFLWVFWFFGIRLINRHLIIHWNHSFTIILGINIIRHIYEKEETKRLKYAFINILGVITILFLFIYFSESYKGIGKPERIAKEYIIKEMNYKENDIREITRLTSFDENQEVFISVDNQQRAFIFIYKNGGIQEVKEL